MADRARQTAIPIWLPPTQPIDVLADPDQRLPNGLIWSLLEDAVTPAAVRPGALVVAGLGDLRFPAFVNSISPDERGTVVLLRPVQIPRPLPEASPEQHPADIGLLQLRRELRVSVRALAAALGSGDLGHVLRWPQWRDLQRLAELPDTALGRKEAR